MTAIEEAERRVLHAAERYATLEADLQYAQGPNCASIDPAIRQIMIDEHTRGAWYWLNRLKDDALMLRDMKGAK